MKREAEAESDWRSRIIAHDGPFVFAAAAVVVALAIGALWWGVAQRDDAATLAPETMVDQAILRHPLTGAVVTEETRPAVYAVVVEESPDARPQDGVDRAFLVYEAPVEGSIARWLVLFSADEDVASIGPVRSARPYFVDWAQEWGALFAHVGGSPESLQDIRARGVYDLNEFWWTSSFWRSSRRVAPHNVYTETKRLARAWEKIVGEEAVYVPRVFLEASEFADTSDAANVTVRLTPSFEEIVWRYDAPTRSYRRIVSGREQSMRDGASLVIANVVVMKTDMAVIDGEGRRRIRTLGEGEATVYQTGRAIDATWRKASYDEPTRFFDADGEEIPWIPGLTWIEVVSQ